MIVSSKALKTSPCIQSGLVQNWSKMKAALDMAGSRRSGDQASAQTSAADIPQRGERNGNQKFSHPQA